MTWQKEWTPQARKNAGGKWFNFRWIKEPLAF
jgi:hypothetical protein